MWTRSRYNLSLKRFQLKINLGLKYEQTDCSADFEILPNEECSPYGDGYTTHEGITTIDKCSQLCRHDSSCNSFIYVTASATDTVNHLKCYLKSRTCLSGIRANSGYISGRKKGFGSQVKARFNIFLRMCNRLDRVHNRRYQKMYEENGLKIKNR